MKGLALSDIKFYYKIVVIRTLWYWCHGRQIIPWNKTENPESDWWMHITQEAFRATGGKEGLFNNSSGTIDFPHQKNDIRTVMYKEHKKSIPAGLRT